MVENIQNSHDASVPAAGLLAELKTLFRSEKEKAEFGYVKLLRDDAQLTKERKESTSTLYEEKLAEAKALVEAATDVKDADVAERRRRVARSCSSFKRRNLSAFPSPSSPNAKRLIRFLTAKKGVSGARKPEVGCNRPLWQTSETLKVLSKPSST